MKKIFGLLVSCSLLFVFVGCEQTPPVVDDKSGDKPEVSENLTDYTKDQKKVVDNFGEPDEFTISFNFEEEPKMETWKYIELGQIFVFVDGEYDDAYSVEFGLPEDQVYLKATIDPKDVYALKDLDDLEELLEVDATSTVDVEEDIWENSKFYDFGGVVNAATIDDELVFVKTTAMVSPYKWDELAAKVENSVPGENDTDRGETFLFDEDYGFTIEFPERWSELDWSEELDEENGIAMISFYMPTDDTEYVADGYVNMFVITAYMHGGESDVPPFETYLGRNNELMYTFSHMNGLPPEDLEEHVKDFDDIMDSIELYDF